MQTTFQSLRSRNRYKLKREKKAHKTKAHYCMYCLKYKTVIICLKRTEVCWLLKRTLNITIRPCVRYITQSYFVTIDLHSITLNQCRIQGIFGASIPVWVPKKSSSTPPRSFFFYQTDKLISFVLRLLKVGHLTRLLLSQVWYGRRKPRRFHTHTHTHTHTKKPQ